MKNTRLSLQILWSDGEIAAGNKTLAIITRGRSWKNGWIEHWTQSELTFIKANRLEMIKLDNIK